MNIFPVLTLTSVRKIIALAISHRRLAMVTFLLSATVAIGQVATPTFQPDQPSSGVFSPSEGTRQFSVQISCATVGATIRYTTNGADPTTSDATIASGGLVA